MVEGHTRILSVGPGPAPEVKIEIVLHWDEVLAIVRTGAVPIPIVDDLMVTILSMAR